jgi:hypothetical protein
VESETRTEVRFVLNRVNISKSLKVLFFVLPFSFSNGLSSFLFILEYKKLVPVSVECIGTLLRTE